MSCLAVSKVVNVVPSRIDHLHRSRDRMSCPTLSPGDTYLTCVEFKFSSS